MKRQKMIAVLPTMLTLGNAVCGFGAITFAAKLGTADFDSHHLWVSGALIFLAMVFDMLDGSVARLTNQTSELGAQLDSLCDAVSFGIAPAFLMLQFTRDDHSLGGQFPDFFTYPRRLLFTIGALYVVCAILRLARFNVESDDEDDHSSFSGLPSPAAAGAIAAFPIAMPGVTELALSAETASAAAWLIPTVKALLPIVAFAVACLMVSRLKYPHFFSQLFRGQRTRGHVIQLVFTLAVVFWVHELAVPLIFCYFAFASPLRAMWAETMGRRRYKSAQA